MRKIICFIMIFISFFTSVSAFLDELDNEVVTFEDVIEVSSMTQNGPMIQATSAVLLDRISKRVLYEKNMNKEVPNASTTKILTAIVACEKGNMDDIVTISSNAVNINGSKIKFRVGDKVSLNDLMIGMLMRSGNDAAIAIAEHIGGSIENFCNMMNEKAFKIGAQHTHFTSPHGLDDEDHYSTAYDLAMLADYALGIPTIANIVCRKTAIIKINDYSREISNTNEMLSVYDGADGVKTGFTGEAGRCLVSSATRDNWQLISVVLGCGTKKQRTAESTQLLNYGFQNYKLVDVYEKMRKKISINVNKSSFGTYDYFLYGKQLYPVRNDEEITYEYIVYPNLEAPLAKNSQIGTIIAKIGSEVILQKSLLIPENISRKSINSYILIIIEKLLKLKMNLF